MVWDEQGRRYLDACAALWYCNVGYGRAEIAEAVASQIRRLPACSAYADLTARPATELAARVAGIAPFEGAVVFFTSGGAESIETAAKLARRYWSIQGQPERTVVLSRERSYHGMGGYGTSIVGTDLFKVGAGPLVPGTARVPWDSVEALEQTIAELRPERVAAFFCEPIIGAGGVLAPPEGYLEGVQRICRETGVLFVADEVICGYGRVGAWFASRRFGVEPDLVTFAKGITSGYVPLGGVIASPRVSEPFWVSPDVGIWRHGYTYSGHATAAAAAHANLDIIEREGLVERGRALEPELAASVQPLAEHALVSEVRCGTGVMAAVQIDPALLEGDPLLPDRVALAARDHGVLTRTLTGGAIQISPALVVARSELEEMAAGVLAALDDVAARLPLAAA